MIIEVKINRFLMGFFELYIVFMSKFKFKILMFWWIKNIDKVFNNKD